MPFKIVATPEFTHAVPVMVPVDGGHREETLRARFRVVPDEEADVDVKAFLQKAFIGVEDLVDDSGKPVVWSDELRDRLIGIPFVRSALARAYMAAITKERLGN